MLVTSDYKKQKAVIIPQWVLNMIIDQLDTQLDALVQEYQYAHDNNNQTKEISEEIELYESALKQIVNQ